MALLPESQNNKIYVITVIVFLCLTVSSEASLLSRSKRNVFQMCQLINFYTGKSCWEFNNYGCFCGYGNAGGIPVDDIDLCCRKHDDCYGRVSCYFWWPQFVGFDVECKHGSCSCKDYDACQRTTCQCDLEFAECLGKGQYNAGFRGYDRGQCQRRTRG